MSPIDTYLSQFEASVRDLSREAVEAVVEALLENLQAGRRIYLIGNGGSASTAAHMMNDLNKTAMVEGQPRFQALALTDNVPLLTAWGNDSAFEDVFVEQLRNFLQPGDLLIAISTSGNSLNLLKAVEYANGHGAVTVGLTGDPGGRLAEIARLAVRVPSPDIGQQESGHLLLDHLITYLLKRRLSEFVG